MAESLIAKLYEVTDKGLDIIYYYYPQAASVVANNHKKFFSIRDERTPSASMKLINDVWCVTDFGDGGVALTPVEICMQEEHKTFKEALHMLCDRYKVTAGIISETNKPQIDVRPAIDDEPEGKFDFELNETFSTFELSVLGPMVTLDILKKYSYYSVKSYTCVKSRKATTVFSTPDYPIFLHECGEFRKIYQPLNYNKAYRFFYNGNKPKEFINGFEVLQKAYDENNKYDESKTPDTSKKTVRKLSEAIFCSGERDALNIAGMGYLPLWLNSETAKISKFDMSKILNMVERVYNIPDIDSTGLKKARDFASEYIDVFTIELPKWLKTYKDSRGQPRKDLRDFLDIHPSRHDFNMLMSVAKPYKFWDIKYDKDKKRHEINSMYFLHFLEYNNFGKITEENTGKIVYCQIKNHIVKRILNGVTIQNFALSYLKDNYIDIDVQNLFVNSDRTKISILDKMSELEINWKDYTMNSQFLFFDNIAINVFKDRIEEKRGENLGINVWEENICKHSFKRIEPAFKWTYDSETGEYHIIVNHIKSHYFRFLINASRMYWREELEQRPYKKREIEEEYAKCSKFEICGGKLSDQEINEQLAHLKNKIYVIGYLLHSYKNYAKALSVWLMENKVNEEGKSSGGSGKSFMIRFLKNLCNIVTLPGRNKKLTDANFLMDRVTQCTDIINIDDATKYFDFDFFYSSITGDMQISRKYVASEEIDYKDSAKLVITSNFPPRNNDGSTMRRMLFCVFSDYYHKKNTDSDYLENRSIFDDFGYELFNDSYKEEWWNEDFNFCVDCLQFYLSTLDTGIIIEPPMSSVNRRINLNLAGEELIDWAEIYFSKEGGNLDCYITRKEIFNDFKLSLSKNIEMSTHLFKKKLEAWAATCEYVDCLNPIEICNIKKQKKITKRDGKMVYEYFYMKSKDVPVTSNF